MTVFDTVLAAVTMLTLMTAAGVVFWDWMRMIRGEKTISGWVKENIGGYATVYVALVAGLIVGSWLGFVAGHLFWPIVGK